MAASAVAFVELPASRLWPGLPGEGHGDRRRRVNAAGQNSDFLVAFVHIAGWIAAIGVYLVPLVKASILEPHITTAVPIDAVFGQLLIV
ncbi:MAG: hypothetical protein NTU65_01110 [Cyanobacteria bacterium]|nr:hypothetical protein [Cyanobacteriota bacterium]